MPPDVPPSNEVKSTSFTPTDDKDRCVVTVETSVWYFLPLIGVSWIPTLPLLSHIRPLLKKSRVEPSVLGDIESFCSTVVADWSVLDANDASVYFSKLAGSKALTQTERHELFNLLPLAVTANASPGGKGRGTGMPPETTILNLKDFIDKGSGDYRGIVHFTPWVQVYKGKIVKAGILNGPSKPGTSHIATPGNTPVPALDDCVDFLGGHMHVVDHGKWEKGEYVSVDDFGFWSHALPGKDDLDKLEATKYTFASSARAVYRDPTESVAHSPFIESSATTARFQHRHQGRVSQHGQKIATRLNGRTAPWITLILDVRLDSGGGCKVSGYHSRFPAHAMYAGSRGGSPKVLWTTSYNQMLNVAATITEARLLNHTSPTGTDAMEFIVHGQGGELVTSPDQAPCFPKSAWRNSPLVLADDDYGDATRGRTGNLPNISAEITGSECAD